MQHTKTPNPTQAVEFYEQFQTDVLSPIEKLGLLNNLYHFWLKTHPHYEECLNKEQLDLLFMELNNNLVTAGGGNGIS